MSAFRFFAILLPLALAACGDATPDTDVETLDQELAANGSDPLLAAAVQDPIMVDPQLSTRSNADAIRPPNQPYAAPVPATDVATTPEGSDGDLRPVPAPAKGNCPACAVARDAITLGALAARQGDPRLQACAPGLRYAAGWATRLPADLPLPGAARVVEAAGTDSAACQVRAVTFTINRPVAHLLDWYYTQASRAGYATEHRSDDTRHMLAGTRAKDGGTYVVFLRDGDGGGTEIDLLTNTGR
ncbi:MAG: hypothetical protein V4537_15510 [Pseudomonadota bacterium]